MIIYTSPQRYKPCLYITQYEIVFAIKLAAHHGTKGKFRFGINKPENMILCILSQTRRDVRFVSIPIVEN